VMHSHFSSPRSQRKFPGRFRLKINRVSGRNETVETGETGETLYFIVRAIRGLGCEKKRKILEFFKKCYFFIRFPILELQRCIGHKEKLRRAVGVRLAVPSSLVPAAGTRVTPTAVEG